MSTSRLRIRVNAAHSAPVATTKKPWQRPWHGEVLGVCRAARCPVVSLLRPVCAHMLAVACAGRGVPPAAVKPPRAPSFVRRHRDTRVG